jgi:peptide/nickel transport system substrate-binding protein
MSFKHTLAALTAATALIAVPAQAATLRWAAQNDVITLDPHSQNHATTNGIMQHVYEGLVRYNKDFGIEPSLATSWQNVSPTQVRFVLRKNVKFHDGSPFTADDVVFSFPTAASCSRRAPCRSTSRASRK